MNWREDGHDLPRGHSHYVPVAPEQNYDKFQSALHISGCTSENWESALLLLLPAEMQHNRATIRTRATAVGDEQPQLWYTSQ
jgi:hypothetical protein